MVTDDLDEEEESELLKQAIALSLEEDEICEEDIDHKLAHRGKGEQKEDKLRSKGRQDGFFSRSSDLFEAFARIQMSEINQSIKRRRDEFFS